MCDVTEESSIIPIEPASLDVIVLIFVLSAIPPEKWVELMDKRVVIKNDIYIYIYYEACDKVWRNLLMKMRCRFPRFIRQDLMFEIAFF